MAAFHINERKTPAYSHGHVFLAGDATNVHSPVWKLALVKSNHAHPVLLESYDAERKPVSDGLMETTSVALRAATSANWLLERLRDGLLARIATLDSVEERVRDAVSEIGIHYRRSPIVRDAGGETPLRAGDRAPDCDVTYETGSHFRMFNLLKEPLHTLIVTQPGPGVDLKRTAALLARHIGFRGRCSDMDALEAWAGDLFEYVR